MAAKALTIEQRQPTVKEEAGIVEFRGEEFMV